MPRYRYGVISDTHGHIPAWVFDVFENVTRIYHCGDIGSDGCLAELQTIAPVRLVPGNMDPWSIATSHAEQVIEETEFGRLVMVHGASFSHANDVIARCLLQEFADVNPRLILFGHSHSPYLATQNGTTVLNPGSASRPRVGSDPSVAILEYDTDSDVLNLRHVTS